MKRFHVPIKHSMVSFKHTMYSGSFGLPSSSRPLPKWHWPAHSARGIGPTTKTKSHRMHWETLSDSPPTITWAPWRLAHWSSHSVVCCDWFAIRVLIAMIVDHYHSSAAFWHVWRVSCVDSIEMRILCALSTERASAPVQLVLTSWFWGMWCGI